MDEWARHEKLREKAMLELHDEISSLRAEVQQLKNMLSGALKEKSNQSDHPTPGPDTTVTTNEEFPSNTEVYELDKAD